MTRRFGLEQAVGLLRPPTETDSKYTRGVVGLLTGSDLYPGAAVLGAAAAVHAGAGYVRYVGPRRCQDLILARRPEVVMSLGACDCWVIGSGLAAISEDDPRYDTMMGLLDPRAGAAALSRGGLDRPSFRVVDAGALLAFTRLEAKTGDQTHGHFVVTPHSGELAQLLTQAGYPISHTEIDADAASRLAAAQRARDILGCTVVLKGARTLVVPIDREPWEVVSPTSWLATAGSGDVLAGLLGTLLAQTAGRLAAGRLDVASLVAVAVYLHGQAAALAAGVSPTAAGGGLTGGDPMASAFVGNPGHPITALEVAEHIPAAIGSLLAR